MESLDSKDSTPFVHSTNKKRGRGRPKGAPNIKDNPNLTTGRVINNGSGQVRKKTDSSHPILQDVFKKLHKVADGVDSQSIAELICKVVEADLHNLIPGDTVSRTQRAIDTLQKINEDMVYSSGGIGMSDNIPDGLEMAPVLQIASTEVCKEVVVTKLKTVNSNELLEEI